MYRNPQQPLARRFRRTLTLSLRLFGVLAVITLTLTSARAGTVLIPGSGTAAGGAAVVVGGNGNNANAFASGIFTGFNHTNNGVASAILTGIGNFITARNSYIGCGNGHVLAGTGASTILSGIGNAIDATGDSAAVLNGTGNTVGGTNSVAAGAGVNSVSNNSFTFGTNVGLDITAAGSVALGDSDPASPEGTRTTIGNTNLNYGGLGSDTFTSIFHGGYLFATDNRMLLGMPGPFQGLAVQNPGGLGTPAFVGINTRLPSAALDVASGNVNIPATTADGANGIVTQNGTRFMHTFGTDNIFLGAEAGNFTLTTVNATRNVGVGSMTLQDLTNGTKNVALGNVALTNNTTGFNNSATGATALSSNTTGNQNCAYGSSTLESNVGGSSNSGFGFVALLGTTGSNNTAIGSLAGSGQTTGDNNICVGANVAGVAAESNTTRIGSAQTAAFISGIRGVTTGVADAVAVVIDSNGQLGTVSSSRRYKEAIADMGDTSERLRKLRPVTFRYKDAFADGGKPQQFGLIAEEVAEVFPELAVRNAEGQPETVKYHLLAPLLLNEVQKLEDTVEEKDSRIGELEKSHTELEARLTKLEKLLEQSAR